MILNSSDAWMLQNVFDRDCHEPTNFWEIINDTPRDLAELPSKVRNQVRRCLRDCNIRIVSNQELIGANGYEVYRRAFERYHDVTVVIADRKHWETQISKDTKYEYWGVFSKESGQLIAYAMNSVDSRQVGYNTLKAIPEFMNRHYPYFGLLYEMNKHYLDELGVKFVSDGFRSITGHSNIQPFLEKNFLFRKAYCRTKIYYKPWFAAAVKLAYPFRKLIPFKMVRNLLNLEALNRGKELCF